jgi:hypothetical protein
MWLHSDMVEFSGIAHNLRCKILNSLKSDAHGKGFSESLQKL